MAQPQSRAAYSSGDGAGAKALSNEGKSHAAKMDDYNRQASDFIFRENNAPGRVDADCIDLHGQFVEEAERILEERIRAERSRGSSHIRVIVGRGNHSVNHVQKLKPRVEEVCRELGLDFWTEENEGRIYVDLKGQGAPGGGRPDHGGHGRPPQHGGQPHHGGQPQHGRPPHHGGQQEEDTGILGALIKCCVVM